jgi:hypothetical protein
MSRLGNSFVRGFGSTLGSFAARSLVASAITSSNEPVDEIGKKSTKSMWMILGLVFIISALIGKYTPNDNHLGMSLFFSSLIIFPIVNLFVVKYKRKKQDRLIRNNLNLVINGTLEEAKSKEIILEIPDTSSMSLYYLEELSINMKRILNKKVRLKEKYRNHEHFNDIMREVIWMGMSVENLKDIKGDPTSYEVSENSKTRTEVLLYGSNKWSGDVFTFKNGILTEFKDR